MAQCQRIMAKQKKSKQDKALEELARIIVRMNEQFIFLRNKLDQQDGQFAQLRSELNFLKTEVRDIGSSIKSIAVKLEKIEQKTGEPKKDESDSLKYAGFYFV